MQRLFKPNNSVLALFMFLPITPSIAAISVFTQSVLNNRSSEVTSIPHHEQRVIDATRYEWLWRFNQLFTFNTYCTKPLSRHVCLCPPILRLNYFRIFFIIRSTFLYISFEWETFWYFPKAYILIYFNKRNLIYKKRPF